MQKGRLGSVSHVYRFRLDCPARAKRYAHQRDNGEKYKNRPDGGETAEDWKVRVGKKAGMDRTIIGDAHWDSMEFWERVTPLWRSDEVNTYMRLPLLVVLTRRSSQRYTTTSRTFGGNRFPKLKGKATNAFVSIPPIVLQTYRRLWPHTTLEYLPSGGN